MEGNIYYTYCYVVHSTFKNCPLRDEVVVVGFHSEFRSVRIKAFQVDNVHSTSGHLRFRLFVFEIIRPHSRSGRTLRPENQCT